MRCKSIAEAQYLQVSPPGMRGSKSTIHIETMLRCAEAFANLYLVKHRHFSKHFRIHYCCEITLFNEK